MLLPGTYQQLGVLIHCILSWGQVKGSEAHALQIRLQACVEEEAIPRTSEDTVGDLEHCSALGWGQGSAKHPKYGKGQTSQAPISTV